MVLELVTEVVTEQQGPHEATQEVATAIVYSVIGACGQEGDEVGRAGDLGFWSILSIVA